MDWAGFVIQMEISTKGTGWMERQMDLGSTLAMRRQNLLERGLTISSKAQDKKSGPMECNMRASSTMARNLATVHYVFHVEPHMLVNFLITELMAREYTIGLMVANMKDHGWITRCTDMGR